MAAASAGAPPPPPAGPRPPRPPDDKIFCPLQETPEAIPILYVFDLAHGTGGYLAMLEEMRLRQRDLAPFTIGSGPYSVPVTPLANPITGLSRHFIVRLVDSDRPKYKIDCLIRDTDLYFVGFRRCLVLTSEEEEALLQEQRQDNEKGKRPIRGHRQPRVPGWGTWYKFIDPGMELPPFLDAQSSGISSAYGSRDKITAGGIQAMRDMLCELATFEDCPLQSESLVKACNRFAVSVCEPSRLRSLYRFMRRCIRLESNPETLESKLWDNIGNWTQLGAQAFGARLIGRGEQMTYRLPEWCSEHELEGRPLSTLGDLVGDQGELRLVNGDITMMGGITESEIIELIEQMRSGARPAARSDRSSRKDRGSSSKDPKSPC